MGVCLCAQLCGSRGPGPARVYVVWSGGVAEFVCACARSSCARGSSEADLIYVVGVRELKSVVRFRGNSVCTSCVGDVANLRPASTVN